MGYNPEKKKLYDKQYYLAKKDEILQKQKVYYEQNKEVINKKSAEYARTPKAKLVSKAYRSKPEIQAKKSEYDKQLRQSDKREVILAKKKETYLKNHEYYLQQGKERRSKPENKQKHLEYCRQPEYRAKKALEDRPRLAKKSYGEYWECALLWDEIHKEVLKLVPDAYDRAKMRGQIDRITARQMYKRSLINGNPINEKWSSILFLQG